MSAAPATDDELYQDAIDHLEAESTSVGEWRIIQFRQDGTADHRFYFGKTPEKHGLVRMQGGVCAFSTSNYTPTP